MDHEEPRIVTAEKPRWFKSPLASDRLRRPSESHPPPSPFKDSLQTSSDEYDYSGYPPFKRYEEPTLLEILYDLFFAANYNVFAQSQSVTNHRRFKSYVGYFSLLWGTWFMVTLYDVRYVTDSIFERIARAVQLGVLVGFTVVAPNFDPEDQDEPTMMTMSLMLFASRICLAIEYAHTLAQIFKYKRARRPFYIQIAINVISAAVYLGVTFCFEEKQSRVFITWYVFTAAEAILSLVVSNYWRTLSFTRTHLMKRLSLITVMILGESIQTVAQNIATIVKTPSAWNPYTIGMITAATATIYCVFLVYFDWMRHLQLPALRQQLWTALHYPFHLSLVLFMQGYTQLILFVKAFNVVDNLTNAWLPDTTPVSDVNETSRSIANELANASAEIFRLYPPQDSMVRAIVNSSIANISTIPDRTWPDLEYYLTSSNETEPDEATLKGFSTFVEQLVVIISALANSIFSSFDIDLSTDVSLKQNGDSNPIKLAENQITISEKTRQRSRLVFAYTYIACGCTLVLLVIMALVSRMSPLGRLPRLRFIICTLLGIGLAVTSVLFFDPDKADNFLDSPWPIPTVLFGWLIVTVLVHVRGSSGGSGRSRSLLDTARNVISLFRPRRRKERDPVRDDGDSQQVALRFWPPTRENTDLSAADTLQEGISVPPKRRRVSFRDVSPRAIPRPGSPHSIYSHAGNTHRKVDGSDQV
ncbi:Low temperature requirement A [Cordyceps fumosorosea ARSEF 2679]|uniref:Low temperature requirement A n=1 Tax=Cordyceps fumosorosea (strain ARSEF 2679) TaxID=1081104 RepID=A0A167TQI3_CORFA|nr:Low temperature requirement A [Cordyceps fumosorosea ARSEF 2679]OAA60842.1 Low temperature requirement A [Cordyceps fumosorosea ARSEF 2679]